MASVIVHVLNNFLLALPTFLALSFRKYSNGQGTMSNGKVVSISFSGMVQQHKVGKVLQKFILFYETMRHAVLGIVLTQVKKARVG